MKKPIDILTEVCYNIYRKGVIRLEKIKELEKLLAQLIKLTSKVIELVGQITLLILAVKTIVDIF